MLNHPEVDLKRGHKDPKSQNHIRILIDHNETTLNKMSSRPVKKLLTKLKNKQFSHNLTIKSSPKTVKPVLFIQRDYTD